MQKESRCLFLDRDGVINLDVGYAFAYDQITYIDGIFSLTRLAMSLGYRIVIVTNQSGIGRGFYTEADFVDVMSRIKGDFLRERVVIDGVYFSPFHPTEALDKFRKFDPSRKPGPGMIIQAKKDLNLDLPKSVLVGDKMSDVFAGLSAGVGTNILLRSSSVINRSRNVFLSVTKLHDVERILRGEN